MKQPKEPPPVLATVSSEFTLYIQIQGHASPKQLQRAMPPTTDDGW
jgi:hypothetical protein